MSTASPPVAPHDEPPHVPPSDPPSDRPASPSGPRRRSIGSIGNIVRSMAVVAGLVAVLILLVPRPNAVVQPPVEVTALAQQVSNQTKWPIAQPQRLADGWRATSVRYVRSTDGLMTWHVGYISPKQQYVALEQTKKATDLWVAAQTNRGGPEGPITAAGRVWQKFDRRDKVQNSLVHRGATADDLTTIITGTAPYAELVTFAEHLQPVKAF